MKKIYVFGDSFTMEHEIYNNVNISSWCHLLKKNIKDYKVNICSIPSIDTQTIIDFWIKNLPFINDEDILIICLPPFHRFRLPLKSEHWWKLQNNIDIMFSGGNVDKKFISNIENGEFINEDFINISKVIKSTINYRKNYLEIINSLVKLTKCKNYVFTWDTLSNKENIIEDKKVLIKNIGFWDTLGDEFIRTDGKSGIAGDNHWNYEMNEKFYNYIISKLNLTYEKII